jgi:hypothetical protein
MLLWFVCVQVWQWPCACARGCKRHDKKTCGRVGRVAESVVKENIRTAIFIKSNHLL